MNLGYDSERNLSAPGACSHSGPTDIPGEETTVTESKLS